jgi:hypothetical protein
VVRISPYVNGRILAFDARNRPTDVETCRVLVLSVLLVAFAATAAPAPKPAPTNPFNLDPIPRPTSLPVIGTTHSRPVCTAIRQAVAPAIQAAMKSDQTFSGFKTNVYDYTVKETESSKDLRLMQMDHTVQEMVKSVDTLEKAVNSPGLDVPRTASPDDSATLLKLRGSLRGILSAQKVQLDAMSGFVETERMSRFGQLSETEQAMRNATGPDMGANANSYLPNAQQTQPPSSGFLRDTNAIFKQPQGTITLDNARLLDKDLTELQSFTTKRESAATAAIIPAARACTPPATPAPAPVSTP